MISGIFAYIYIFCVDEVKVWIGTGNCKICKCPEYIWCTKVKVLSKFCLTFPIIFSCISRFHRCSGELKSEAEADRGSKNNEKCLSHEFMKISKQSKGNFVQIWKQSPSKISGWTRRSADLWLGGFGGNIIQIGRSPDLICLSLIDFALHVPYSPKFCTTLLRTRPEEQ